jgi:hypothetical protein
LVENADHKVITGAMYFNESAPKDPEPGDELEEEEEEDEQEVTETDMTPTLRESTNRSPLHGL